MNTLLSGQGYRLSRPGLEIAVPYRDEIGRPRNEVATPALLLDLDVMDRNIEYMAGRIRKMPVELRPHIKVHKSPEIALRQLRAGAIGVATATVWEAVAMLEAGIGDVLIANQVVGARKIETLAMAAEHGVLTVAVDDISNVEALSQAASSAGTEIGVLVELDVGMGRCGVRSKESAIELAGQVESVPGVRFMGVQGYEGHCMLEPDRGLRVSKANAAMDYVADTVETLNKSGFKCQVVSAGGTGTYDITGEHAVVTELQAGSYALMDAFHGGLVPDFDVALTVLGTVVSRQGDTIVLDVGRKAIGIDFITPFMIDHPGFPARYFAEEHALFDVDDSVNYAIGDTVELLPGYGPTTVNLHDVFHVLQGDTVVDIWPVVARGQGPRLVRE